MARLRRLGGGDDTALAFAAFFFLQPANAPVIAPLVQDNAPLGVPAWPNVHVLALHVVPDTIVGPQSVAYPGVLGGLHGAGSLQPTSDPEMTPLLHVNVPLGVPM